MRHFISTISIYFSCAAVALLGLGNAQAKEAEYKAAGPDYYLRASVLKAEPGAVIVDAGGYRKEGDSYFVRESRRPSQEIYVTVMREWLEPITPPSMPASLGIAPDVMQIREPQGDVEVAPPDNPTAFKPATEAMPIENGAVVKTGTDGTAAVLFGGVNSARLTPNSEATVQQGVTPELRMTRVDLKSGVAFSKVGLRPGEKQDYQVHTPFGVAAARGTDFVCVAMPERTDVWVAQGTVQFDQPNGQTVGTVKSSGKGQLQIIRFPVIDDARAAMMATSQTMTEAMNFIPMVNLKVKTLRDQMAQGVKMTPQEKKYLSLMKHVPCLIKLTLVETLPPPAPPKPVILAPPPRAKAVEMSTETTTEVSGTSPRAKPVKKVKKGGAKPVEESEAQPVTVVVPATPLPEAQSTPPPEVPAAARPAPEDSPGMTAQPLNHMGRIMQMAPHEEVAPPRAQPVTPSDENTNTETNNAPITNGPHDTTP